VTHYSNSEPPAIRASIRHDKDVYIGVRSDVRTLMLGTYFPTPAADIQELARACPLRGTKLTCWSCNERSTNARAFVRKRALFKKYDPMKTKKFVLATTVLFALDVACANAGPCGTEIDSLTKTLAAKDAGSGPTVGASGGTHTTPSSSAQHPPTSVMRQETEGKATSPEDVRRQTTGQPPAAQQGAAGAGATAGSPMQASSALERARMLDQQGKEAECMEAVRQAKQLAGVR
jgi:hypothetical protein